MNFNIPVELADLRQTVRGFVDDELIPIELVCVEGPALRPGCRAPLEEKAKQRGLWLLDAPLEYGGRNLGLLAHVIVWEELSRTIALPIRAPGVFGPEVKGIMLSLSEEQRSRYLLPFIRGEKKTAFVQTEPDAGSDPGAMRTTAVRRGDVYVINGYKRFISNAADADFFQLVAATDRAKGSRGGLSVFLVDAKLPGIRIVRKTVTMMAAETYEIAFDDVEVPVEDRVGAEGEGMGRAQSWLVGNRLRQACAGLGVARRCIELMVSHVRRRAAGGAPRAELCSVEAAIADSFMEHYAVQLLVYQAAARVDAGEAVRSDGYMAKVQGTELGHRVADRCMEIHGAAGLTTSLPIEKMWRDSRSLIITEGPAEVMRMVLAREILRGY